MFCFSVSPERNEHSYGIKNIELVYTPGMQHSCRHTETPFPSFTQHLRTSKSRTQAVFLKFLRTSYSHSVQFIGEEACNLHLLYSSVIIYCSAGNVHVNSVLLNLKCFLVT